MNLNYIEEVNTNLRKVQRNGTNRQEKEAYQSMMSKFNQLLITIEDQEQILRRMAQLADDARNAELCSMFQRLSKQLGQEYEMLENSKKACRTIVNG